MKNRPEQEVTSNAFDGIEVRTPGQRDASQEIDKLSRLSTVGVVDVSMNKEEKVGGVSKFVTNMMKTDKEQYERLIELMRFYNIIGVDMRNISELKATFISKELGNLLQVPLTTFKDSMREIFKHFRQVDEIISKTGDCVVVELIKDGVKEKVADSAKFSSLIEFIKCFPLLVKRDKNAS